MEKELLTDLIIKNFILITSIYHETGSKGKRINRPCWGIIMKFEGETEYLCNKKKYISNKNNLVILPKGSNYEWHCTKSGYFYDIEFDCDKTIDHIYTFPINNSEKILKIYKELEYKRTLKTPLCELECIKGTYDIILQLLQNAPRIYQSADKMKKILPAVDYIAQNYNKSITNDELAALTSLSTVYFRKLFTDIFEMSPITYIHHLRIKKAQEMLRSDYGSITDIAQSLGYLNIYDFSRTFKKHTGLSPTNFMKCDTQVHN